MDVTYSGFMHDAAASVQSAYAKGLLDFLTEADDKDNLFAKGAGLLRRVFADVLTVPGFVGSALLLSAIALLFRLLRTAWKSEAACRAMDTVIAMLTAVVVVGAAFEILSDCAVYMQDISLFFGELAPVIGILTAAGGNVTAAGTGGIALSVFLAIAEWIVTQLAPVVVTCFLGLALISAVGGQTETLSLAKGVRNALFGMFSLVTSVFFVIVGCQNAAAAQADTVGAKTLRLLVSSAVPIVGGTVGDALKLVSGSLVTVKNAIGISAVLFLLAMFIPVLVRIWFCGILLSLLGFFCECAELSAEKNLLLQVKCAFDFALAAHSAVVVMGLLNIGLFIGSLPAVAA